MKVSTEILSARHVVVSLGASVDVLFSYRTPVAARVGSHWYRTDKKYGPTTNKHIAGWLQKASGASVQQVSEDYLALLLPTEVAKELGYSELRAREALQALCDHI